MAKKLDDRAILRGDLTEEEERYQQALEAQLLHTKKKIEDALGDHPHFTDDCGEYLSSALELSAFLQSGRENGMEGLIDAFKELAEDDGESALWNNFASDGISLEVDKLVVELGGTSFNG